MGRQAGSNPPMDDGDKCTFNPEGEIDEVEGAGTPFCALLQKFGSPSRGGNGILLGNVNLTMTMIVGTGMKLIVDAHLHALITPQNGQ